MGDSDLRRPFEEAAFYYDRFRPPYAPEAFQYVADAFALGRSARVLDLGCGPGSIAIPLSRLGAEVVALDRDEAMLVEGRSLAAERGAETISWRLGEAPEAIGDDLGRFRLIAFGQSLHWMDRDRVLARAAEVLEEGGGIALFDKAVRGSPESWVAATAPVVARYLGEVGRHPLKHPESAHEPSLRRSTYFADFDVRGFDCTFTRDFTSVLGCLYSSVRLSPSRLGDRRQTFEAEVFDVLARLRPSGLFEERIETTVIVARNRAAGP